MNLNGICCRKRERTEGSITEDPTTPKKGAPSLVEVIFAHHIIEEAEAEHPKRERPWEQEDENRAAFKRLNYVPASRKRPLEEVNYEEEKDDDLPLIEEMQEPPSTGAKVEDAALQLIIPISERQLFRKACSQGNLAYIKTYIDNHPSAVTDLCRGMTYRNNQMNELLVGLSFAIAHDKTAVIDFLIDMPAVKQNLPFSKNLILRVAFYNNRLFTCAKLLQMPAVLNTIEPSFIERYLVSSAETGNIFQLLLVLSIPGAERALHLLGAVDKCYSLLDIVRHTANTFPNFGASWNGFLETDGTVVAESGHAMFIQRDELLAVLERTLILPDFENLTI